MPLDKNQVPSQPDTSEKTAKSAGTEVGGIQSPEGAIELSIHQQIILRRWLLIAKMDSKTPLPSPCVGVCLTNAENICTGCFRNIDEISGWASYTPNRQLEVWNNLLKRIGISSTPSSTLD
jgi:predicted Fe-S protein YdhL (DUF1289 family)